MCGHCRDVSVPVGGLVDQLSAPIGVLSVGIRAKRVTRLDVPINVVRRKDECAVRLQQVMNLLSVLDECSALLETDHIQK